MNYLSENRRHTERLGHLYQSNQECRAVTYPRRGRGRKGKKEREGETRETRSIDAMIAKHHVATRYTIKEPCTSIHKHNTATNNATNNATTTQLLQLLHNAEQLTTHKSNRSPISDIMSKCERIDTSSQHHRRHSSLPKAALRMGSEVGKGPTRHLPNTFPTYPRNEAGMHKRVLHMRIMGALKSGMHGKTYSWKGM